MENKVTSYELSKQLHELEFDCENHTGWWGIQIANTDESPTGSVQWFHHLCTETWEICKSPTKAYDCDDLLGWLAYHQEMAACWEWKLIYRPYSTNPSRWAWSGVCWNCRQFKVWLYLPSRAA